MQQKYNPKQKHNQESHSTLTNRRKDNDSTNGIQEESGPLQKRQYCKRKYITSQFKHEIQSPCVKLKSQIRANKLIRHVSATRNSNQCVFGKHVERAFLRFAEKWWVSCTVHGTRKYGIQQKKPLKLGLTALFTNLKIISLQYFQFSAISGIQTYLN